MSNLVEVQKSVLEWAVEESGLHNELIQNKFKYFDSWLSGEKKPTFIQLKNLSKVLRVPFGMMFMKNPPRNSSFNVEFRTINQKIHNSFSKDLKDTLMEMDYRKSWMSEYRKNNGFNKIEFDNTITENDTAIIAKNKIMKILRLENSWQLKIKSSYDLYNFLRHKIENLGILVMMNGIVKNNTHRNLDIEEFRAFVLSDDYSPLIFVNRNDSDYGLVFSLIHEFIHILLDQVNDNILLDKDDLANERRVNEFTAEFLLPNDALLEVFNIENDSINEISRIANYFNISTTVVSIKSFNMKLIDFETHRYITENARYHFLRTKKNREKPTGGNFYSTAASRISKDFYNSVIHQAEGGKIQFTEAYKLLNLKGSTYDGFKSYVNRKLYD